MMLSTGGAISELRGVCSTCCGFKILPWACSSCFVFALIVKYLLFQKPLSNKNLRGLENLHFQVEESVCQCSSLHVSLYKGAAKDQSLRAINAKWEELPLWLQGT